MIQELDTVVLAHDFDMYALKQGDVGTVVDCYQDGKSFDVEFVTGEGKTIPLATLLEADIRPMGREEILHVRVLVPAVLNKQFIIEQ